MSLDYKAWFDSLSESDKKVERNNLEFLLGMEKISPSVRLLVEEKIKILNSCEKDSEIKKPSSKRKKK